MSSWYVAFKKINYILTIAGVLLVLMMMMMTIAGVIMD